MARHDDRAVRRLPGRQLREHVYDGHDGPRRMPRDRVVELLEGDAQTPAARLGIAPELRVEPAARGPDPALLRERVAHRVAGAEADQPFQARPDPVG